MHLHYVSVFKQESSCAMCGTEKSPGSAGSADAITDWVSLTINVKV